MRSPRIDWTAVRIALGAVALAALAGVLLFRALDLLPPKTLRMAAGGEGGAYHAIARRYRAALARDGLTLEIVETRGSVENMALLAAGDVEVALMQGGIPAPEDSGVEALAAVFQEPLLIFHRTDDPGAADPARWDERRIAIGPEGSGTRAAVLSAYAALDVTPPHGRFSPLGGGAAADALVSGDVDAAVFVAPITAPYLAPLLENPRAAISSIRDVEALARRMPSIRLAEIPAATLDYAARRPPEALTMPALVAALAAHEDLHPALVDRLVAAAHRIHREADLLTEAGAFPGVDGLSLPLNAQAASLVTSGPPPLDGVLPFWVTAQISRVLVLVLPVLFLLLPLLRLAPGVYEWRMGNRVWRRYEALADIDHAASETADPGALDALERDLDALERSARDTALPRRFRAYGYALRLHIDHVRASLRARRRALAASGETGGAA